MSGKLEKNFLFAKRIGQARGSYKQPCCASRTRFSLPHHIVRIYLHFKGGKKFIRTKARIKFGHLRRALQASKELFVIFLKSRGFH